MTTFLTVKEAAQFIGRSPSAVRRIIHPIVKNDQHPDREHIRPSVKDTQQLRMKGENFAWLVSQELLERAAPPRPAAERAAERAPASAGDGISPRELVSLLRDQLQQSHEQLNVKDRQIAQLSEITTSLNERLREGNVLIQSLQRQLLLPSGEQRSAVPAADPTNIVSPAAGNLVPKSPTPKAGKPAAKKQPKRSFFARLFA